MTSPSVSLAARDSRWRNEPRFDVYAHFARPRLPHANSMFYITAVVLDGAYTFTSLRAASPNAAGDLRDRKSVESLKRATIDHPAKVQRASIAICSLAFCLRRRSLRTDRRGRFSQAPRRDGADATCRLEMGSRSCARPTRARRLSAGAAAPLCVRRARDLRLRRSSATDRLWPDHFAALHRGQDDGGR